MTTKIRKIDYSEGAETIYGAKQMTYDHAVGIIRNQDGHGVSDIIAAAQFVLAEPGALSADVTLATEIVTVGGVSAAPEHDFSQSRDQWEQSVIDNAAYFTTARHKGRGNYDRREFPTMAEAAGDADDDPRAMVYACTVTGRSVLVPRDKWPQAVKEG